MTCCRCHEPITDDAVLHINCIHTVGANSVHPLRCQVAHCVCPGGDESPRKEG